MRRTVVFLLLTLVMFPAIGQEVLRTRNCRPKLEQIDLSKHIQRRASAKNRTDTVVNPLIGERRQLVVLAEFADKGFKGDSLQTLQQWDKILNTKNLNDTLFFGSLHDYFYDQSYGQFNVSFDLFYVAVDSVKKYRSTNDDDENSKYLVQDIVSVIDDNVNDWEMYDWNNDGKVDQLLIIYAGKGMNDGGGKMSIWPHQWWMSEHEDCNPIPVTTGLKTYLVDSYCAVAELSGRGDYGSFGTLCHEFSHCFGLPDFYNGSTQFVGSWDLMDYGNFNGNGFHPCGYSAFERAFMGWITPVELDNDTVITGFQALSDAPMSYLIRNDGWADEYYLVENRQMKGWDELLPDSGIVVFHVDYDEDIFHYGMPNEKTRKRYTIFPANNKTYFSKENIKGWAYPNNGNNSLTNTSEPAAELNNLNSDGTLFMNKPITEMAVVSGVAQFKFCYPLVDGIGSVKLESVSEGPWFSIQGDPLPGVPERQGLYIREGKLVLVR